MAASFALIGVRTVNTSLSSRALSSLRSSATPSIGPSNQALEAT